MYALLGNGKGKVKPWYLPFDWVFCMIDVKGYAKVRIVKNSAVANVYALPVELVDGVVIGLYKHKPHLTPRVPDAGDSATSSGIVNASAESTSQTVTQAALRG